MGYLIFVSILWAFSFPLIGHYLVGQNVANPVDNYFIILVRFGLAFIVFLPFLLPFSCFNHASNEEKKQVQNLESKTAKNSITPRLKLSLIAIGAVQIGLMYICYYRSFAYLQIHEVALFTIFTPFYVSLFYDICSKKFHALYLASIALSVLGAYVIKAGEISGDFLAGFLWIQGANACFGIGQSAYKYVMQTHAQKSLKQAHFKQESFQRESFKQARVFGYFYLGALCVGLPSFLLFGDTNALPKEPHQCAILLYLGVVASGLGYFLWNKGACKVNSGILAIMNNALIPIAIVANWLIWGQGVENLARFLCGSALIVLSLAWHYRIVMKEG